MRRKVNLSASKQYIAIDDVARLAGVPLSALQDKISAGTIQAISTDGTVTKKKRANGPTLADRQAYVGKYFAHLKGKPIWVAEAARKYGIPHQTISRWMTRGYIKQVGRDESHSQKILLDEADVAYCAEVYRVYSSKGRRWLFNDDGTPYIPKGEPSLDVITD
ncbi:MAG TPA: hypothetical protein VI547_14650 [Anaerolineales bacterium]|nr:hypothetical protein [Anaerolineales bacterium]